ncbi:MAG TPA: heme ABC exporter ATP-binding protein CcmA [Acidocella sp.]|nr:heme ABC exporter ATP-binding protein CcmA [Acidocella sp.]
MFTASNLSVFRGERLVFSNVSFSLASGGALLLRGANGAGKSSLLRALAGLTPLAAGELRWDGENVLGDLSWYVSRLAWLGHLDAVKPALTAAEHVPVAFLEPLGLGRFADLPVRLLSAGQKRRLALARVMASKAALWLLDEPTTGLDTESEARFVALCEAHRAAGGMIIASTHTPLALYEVDVLAL